MNERRVFDAVLVAGPLSRKAVGRVTGMAAPTITKAADSLLERGLLEETNDDATAPRKAGRPGRLLRLAATRSAVLGIVIDARQCTVVAAGIDSRHGDAQTLRFTTPTTYRDLIARLARACRTLIRRVGGELLGVGISVPGLTRASPRCSSRPTCTSSTAGARPSIWGDGSASPAAWCRSPTPSASANRCSGRPGDSPISRCSTSAPGSAWA
jgi:N-acetylglucosamine repressor